MRLDFRRNLSKTDRVIRAFLGFFVLSLPMGKPIPMYLWGIVIAFAGTLLLEAYVGY